MIKTQKLKYLVLAFFSLLRRSKMGIISQIYSITRFDAPFSISYSQGGEDLALSYFLREPKGFYIDVGAHHPNRFSVTRLLYQRGWVGIDVDANPDAQEIFEKWRPKNQFLNRVVGNGVEQIFFRFHEGAISTSSLEWKDKFLSEGNPLKDQVVIPGITLRELFDLVPFGSSFDLVNLDIEGGDVEALKVLLYEPNKPARMPTWFLLESPAGVENALKSEQVTILKKLGYEAQAILPMSTLMKLID